MALFWSYLDFFNAVAGTYLMVSCKVRNLNFARVTRFMVDMILPEVGSYVLRKEFIYFLRKPK